MGLIPVESLDRSLDATHSGADTLANYLALYSRFVTEFCFRV